MEHTFLHTRGDEGHGNVSLDAVHPHPRRHDGKHAGNQIHKTFWGVVFIQSLLPQLVQPRASDDQRGIDLQPIRPTKIQPSL